MSKYLEDASCVPCGSRDARCAVGGWVCAHCRKPWQTEMVKRKALVPFPALSKEAQDILGAETYARLRG